jgi:hypothetical protein
MAVLLQVPRAHLQPLFYQLPLQRRLLLLHLRLYLLLHLLLHPLLHLRQYQ